MDLNVLPSGYLGSLYNNNKNKKSEEYSTKTRLSFHEYIIKEKKINKPKQKYGTLRESRLDKRLGQNYILTRF